jgi:hypothetical protein
MADLISKMILELDGFRKTLETAKSEGIAAGDKIGDGVASGVDKGMRRALLKLGGTLLAAFAFDRIISKAEEAESAMAMFNGTARAAGQAAVAAAPGFIEYAESLQRTSNASSEAILQGGALLQSIGHLSGQGLKVATKDALNLAAGMRKDIPEAMSLVARAAEGNVTQFQKWGAQIDSSGTDAQKFGQVLEWIRGRFNGMSEIMANTFEGAAIQAKNAFDEILKNLGLLVTQSPVAIALLKELKRVFYEAADAIKEAGKEDALGKFVENLGEARDSIVGTAMAAEFMFNLFRLAFADIREFGQIILIGVTAPLRLLSDIFILVTDLAGKALNVLTDHADKFPKKVRQMIAGAHEALGALDPVKQKLKDFFDTQLDVLADRDADTNNAMAGLFKFNVSESIDDIVARIQKVVAAARDAMRKGGDQVGEGFASGLRKRMDESIEALNQTMRAGIVNLIATTLSSIGHSMVQSADGFDKWKIRMLGILGDLAIQMGSVIMAAGIAEMHLFSFNPFGMIAAGAALIVLGGVLKGFADQASAGMGGGSSASPAMPSTDFARDLTSPDDLDEKKAATITVHVNGPFDQREVGKQMFDILNEHLGRTGAKFVPVRS